MIEPDKSFKINNNPYSENLVHTGTIADGSCFFHSILLGLIRNYRKFSLEEKTKIVKDLRSELSENLSPEIWISLGKGEVFNSVFFDLFLKGIDVIYVLHSIDMETQVFQNEEDKLFVIELFKTVSQNDLKIFFDSFPKNIFMEKIYEPSFSGKDLTPRKLIDNMNKNFVDLLSKTISDTNHQKNYFFTFKVIVESLDVFVTKIGFKMFKEKIKDPGSWVDEYLLEYVMECLDVNILVINANTKKAYKISEKNIYKKRKSVIVYYIPEFHYESVGIYNEDNSIERLFDYKDELIQKIYADL